MIRRRSWFPKWTLLEWLVVIMSVVLLIALLLPAQRSSFDGIRFKSRFALQDIARIFLNAVHDGEFSTEKSGIHWREKMLQLVAADRSAGENIVSADNELVENPEKLFRIQGHMKRNGPLVRWVIRSVNSPDSYFSRPDWSVPVPDGAANTIVFVAVEDDGDSWATSADATINKLFRAPYFGPEADCRGLVAAFADGSIFWLSPKLSREDLLELISANGNASRSGQIMQRLRDPGTHP